MKNEKTQQGKIEIGKYRIEPERLDLPFPPKNISINLCKIKQLAIFLKTCSVFLKNVA